MKDRPRNPETISSLLYNSNIKLDGPEEMKYKLEAEIINTGLVDYSKETKTQYFYTIKLNHTGIVELGKYGNFLNYISVKEKELEEATKEKEESKIKHWFETENARLTVEDYAETKSRAVNSYWWSIFAIGIALLTLLQQWMCNKHV